MGWSGGEGILGIIPYTILTFWGHGPDVNHSFVGHRPWKIPGLWNLLPCWVGLLTGTQDGVQVIEMPGAQATFSSCGGMCLQSGYLGDRQDSMPTPYDICMLHAKP